MIEGLDCAPASAEGWIKGIQETLKKFVHINPLSFTYDPDFLKIQEICHRAVDEWPWLLEYVPDQYKTKEMCDKAVEGYPSSLQSVPDLFVERGPIDVWYGPYHNEDKFFGWYDADKKQKAEKAKINEELLPIAWHSSRHWDWCMSEDEKKKRKNCGSSNR